VSASVSRLVQKYGPWALVTGASDGIGRAFARHLAAFQKVMGLSRIRKRQRPGDVHLQDLVSGPGQHIPCAPEQVFADGVTVISFVGEQGLGFGHGHVEQRGDGPVIRHLAACQDEAKRAALTVTAGMDFARKAAAASTKAFLAGPPLAPAA